MLSDAAKASAHFTPSKRRSHGSTACVGDAHDNAEQGIGGLRGRIEHNVMSRIIAPENFKLQLALLIRNRKISLGAWWRLFSMGFY